MGHAGAESHHDRKKLGVCNAKDLEVSRLQETVNMEQFILCRDGLDEYLENSPGWNRSTEVLETVRSWAFENTPQRVNLISGIEDMVGVINKSEQQVGLLKTKHNTTTDSLFKDVDDRNGFKLYRMMSWEYDPRAEGTDTPPLDQVVSMGKHTCKTFDETYAANKQLKKLVDEYNKVCGERPQLEERLKCWALWNMLDKHTLAKAELRPELKGHGRSFVDIRNLLEELHVESLSTQLYSKIFGRGDAMDVGGVWDNWAWLT